MLQQKCAHKVTLERPALRFRDGYVECLKEFQQEDPLRPIHWQWLENFELYLEWCREEQHGSETQAPQTTYWIICDDENAVGKLTIRHSLTPKLEKLGGHFGYEIRPSYRRKGIASVALALGLLKIRTLGVSDVVITCDEDNLGSIGVMEHNGGILIEKYSVPDWPKPVRKYRFSLE